MPDPAGRAAVFDIIGTSFSLDKPRRALSALGAPEHALELWFGQTLRDSFALSHAGGYAPLKEVLAAELPRTLGLLGIEAGDANLKSVLSTFTELDPRPDLVETVELLHGAGWRLLALTMGAEEATRGLLDRAGIASRFAACLSVDSIQVTKPNPAAYQLARTEQAAETWMLAAHAWDIAGAARAGLRTAFITSVEGAYLRVYPEPDIVAGSLLEAAKALLAR